MKIPKCTKSVSGKHEWINEVYGVVGYRHEQLFTPFTHQFLESSWPVYGMNKITPCCKYCGIIDDTKKKK